MWRYFQSFAHLAPNRKKRRALRYQLKLGSSSAASYITAGLEVESWERMAAWLKKYYEYLRVVAADEDSGRPSPRLMMDNARALEFLAIIADEKKGVTRVAKAIRAINFIRSLLGIDSLSSDPRTSLLQRGALKMFPHRAKGAVPFPELAVVAIVAAWGRSRRWWERMAALFIYVAFLTLLRGAGMRSAPGRGVTWLVEDLEATDPESIPAGHTGALILVTKRKTAQTTFSWVPLHRGRAIIMLAKHVRWCKKLIRRPMFLFPARSPTCFQAW